MSTFFRGDYNEIWIQLSSNEILGILDTKYIEDYNGNDGAITLKQISSGNTYSILMEEALEETVEIPHDILKGFVDLSLIENGPYVLQGRVRDEVGNYTIIGDYFSPIGTERILDLSFSLVGGSNIIVVDLGILNIKEDVNIISTMYSDRLLDLDLEVNEYSIRSNVFSDRYLVAIIDEHTLNLVG